MESREYKLKEWGLKVSQAFKAVGLDRRGLRLEKCLMSTAVYDGEQVWKRRSCNDVFCPFCNRRRVPLVAAQFKRLDIVNFMTFTWREGVKVELVGEAIRDRWKYVRFCLGESSGVCRWEFTQRPNKLLHLHCHVVTNSDWEKTSVRFFYPQERRAHCKPFDGNAKEVAKYLTPSGDPQLVAEVAAAIHGKRVRTSTSWGVCRKFDFLEGVSGVTPPSELDVKMRGLLRSEGTFSELGSYDCQENTYEPQQHEGL